MKTISSIIVQFLMVLILSCLIYPPEVYSNSKATSLAPEASAADIETLVAVETHVQGFELFKDIPILKEAFINSAPIVRNDDVVVGELGVNSGNKELILELAEEIANDKHGTFDSLLIAHKGKLLFESYYRRGRINLPHGQASATKTYTGLLLGRAIQLGYLSMSDLDKPIVSFLKDLETSKFIEGAEKITLHQALTMTTGLHVSDENRERINNDPERLKGQGQVQLLFELSDPITSESQAFRYSAGPELVMQVIETVVPGSAKDFIKNEFLEKLGITTYVWLTAESGLPESGWRASITARDMVKIGSLILNKGVWQGEQLLPETYIARAISRINVAAEDIPIFGGGQDVSNQGYGYFFWNADLNSGENTYYSASAQGGGGQFIILIEELDLIVVATGHERDVRTLQMTAERILPAFN